MPDPAVAPAAPTDPSHGNGPAPRIARPSPAEAPRVPARRPPDVHERPPPRTVADDVAPAAPDRRVRFVPAPVRVVPVRVVPQRIAPPKVVPQAVSAVRTTVAEPSAHGKRDHRRGTRSVGQPHAEPAPRGGGLRADREADSDGHVICRLRRGCRGDQRPDRRRKELHPELHPFLLLCGFDCRPILLQFACQGSKPAPSRRAWPRRPAVRPVRNSVHDAVPAGPHAASRVPSARPRRPGSHTSSVRNRGHSTHGARAAAHGPARRSTPGGCPCDAGGLRSRRQGLPLRIPRGSSTLIDRRCAGPRLWRMGAVGGAPLGHPCPVVRGEAPCKTCGSPATIGSALLLPAVAPGSRTALGIRQRSTPACQPSFGDRRRS